MSFRAEVWGRSREICPQDEFLVWFSIRLYTKNNGLNFKPLFLFLCTRPENRTPIARLRILSTNRYTSRAFYFWDCKDMASFFYFQIFLQFFRIYFRNTKNTAIIRQMNAARWFHCRPCPLNISVTITVNTVREMTSWMTFSCIREKGPPLPLNPIRFAGTCAQYSKNASAHEKSMTAMSGHPDDIFICWSFRCPYQANVMKILEVTSKRIVQTAFIVLKLRYCSYSVLCFPSSAEKRCKNKKLF